MLCVYFEGLIVPEVLLATLLFFYIVFSSLFLLPSDSYLVSLLLPSNSYLFLIPLFYYLLMLVRSPLINCLPHLLLYFTFIIVSYVFNYCCCLWCLSSPRGFVFIFFLVVAIPTKLSLCITLVQNWLHWILYVLFG